MQPLPRTFLRTIRVWWTFVWRTFVYSLIASFAGSVLIGTLTGILSEFGRVMAILTPIVVNVVIAGAVGLFVMYSNILDEEFGDFRVALLPPDGAALETPSLSSNSAEAVKLR
jgi:Na+/citrate or Na+/malate symporter